MQHEPLRETCLAIDLYESKPLADALRKVGFLGSWHIDYTVDRVQADGRVGTVFGVSPGQMRDGVALQQLDAAYYGDDLEVMKRVRRSMIGRGGPTRLRYGLRYGEDQESTFVECSAYVTLDRDGRLKEACGTLMDIGALKATEDASTSSTDLERLASHLLEGARIAKIMQLSNVERGLRPALVMVGRLLAKRIPNLRRLQ